MIYSEWSDLSGSTQYKLLQRLHNDYISTVCRYEKIRTSLMVLNQRYSGEVVRYLQSIGYTYEFNYNDFAAYRLDLERVFAKTKTLEITIQIKKKQYDDLVNSFDKKEVTWQDWNLMIASVEESQGFHFDRRIITVGEFSAYKKLAEMKVESQRKELEKINKK